MVGGPVCAETQFAISLVVPMPANYALAGYGAFDETLRFYAPGMPQHLLTHSLSDFLQGNLTVIADYSLFKQITPYSMTRAYDSTAVWVIAPHPDSGKFGVISASDGGLTNHEYNLPPIGPDDALSSLQSNNPFRFHAVVRVGSSVFEHVELMTTWSPVASLGSAGTSNWKGLAVVKWNSTLRRIFTLATINGGGSGIVEQYWPSAIPNMAGPPVIVYNGTDLVPFAISPDGCEMYTSRVGAMGLEVVVLRR